MGEVKEFLRGFYLLNSRYNTTNPDVVQLRRLNMFVLYVGKDHVRLSRQNYKAVVLEERTTDSAFDWDNPPASASPLAPYYWCKLRVTVKNKDVEMRIRWSERHRAIRTDDVKDIIEAHAAQLKTNIRNWLWTVPIDTIPFIQWEYDIQQPVYTFFGLLVITAVVAGATYAAFSFAFVTNRGGRALLQDSTEEEEWEEQEPEEL